MEFTKGKLKLHFPEDLLLPVQEKFVLPQFVKQGNPFDDCVNVNYISCGAHGSLYTGISRKCGTMKVFKVINAALCETEKIQKALNEAEIGLQMNHPHLLPIKEVWYDGTRFLFVMELITPISIETIVDEPLQFKLVLFQQLVSAVSDLVSKGFLHGDIKLQNIGLRNQHLVLYDYGEATKISGHYPVCIGTILHMAPEVFKYCQYSASSEVWALMSLLVEMLTGKQMILHLFDAPPDSVSEFNIQTKIGSLTYPPIPAVFKEDSSPSGQIMLHILQRGLAIDPTERLTLPDLEHLLQELLALL
jgi:serine/threonine protein kinase